MCFLGGSLTQKYFGADDSSTAAAGGPGGFPAGVPEGFPGGGAGGLPATSGVGAGAAPVEEDPSDSVIGTVVEIKGDTWVVEDLGGERHEVTVAETPRSRARPASPPKTSRPVIGCRSPARPKTNNYKPTASPSGDAANSTQCKGIL